MSRYPTTGIAGCCARAASGHAAAAPPSAASNSRRPMVTVIRPCRARCVGNDTTPRACSLAVQGGQDAGCFHLYRRLELHYSRRQLLANAARVPAGALPAAGAIGKMLVHALVGPIHSDFYICYYSGATYNRRQGPLGTSARIVGPAGRAILSSSADCRGTR